MGDDIVEQSLIANTHDRILFFTDMGRVFQTLAYEIPEGARVAKGRALVNFLDLGAQESALSDVAGIPLRQKYGGHNKSKATATGTRGKHISV